MAQWKLAGSTAIAALLVSNMAFADVTPEEVWTNWKALLSANNATVTTESEGMSGDAFVVTGLNVVTEQEGAASSMAIAEISFADLGDGTVQVTMSDTAPLTLTIPANGSEGSKPQVIGLEISQPGNSTIASGTVDATNYDFTSPSITIALTQVDGAPAADKNLNVSMTLTEASGKYAVSGAADKTVAADLLAKSVVFDVAFTDPATQEAMKMAGTLSDMAGTSTTTLLADMDMNDLAAALAAGFAVDGNFSYGKGDYSFDIVGAEGPMNMVAVMGAGNVSVSMNKDGLSYGGGNKDVTITASGAAIPFPEIKASYADSAFNFAMPISKGDAPQNFGFLLKLVDLAVSEDIWGMVDPTAALPHDPLTIVLDTKGTAKLNANLMNEAEMVAAGATAGELHSLDITTLQIKALGADITGDGALTFDNTDLVTFGGMPKPTGTVNLKAIGINGLLDKITAMGLVPEDQIMGARMMMGMFAKPIDGEADGLSSTLEFKDGGFFANGMQLQ